MRFPYFRQRDLMDCGPTCLKMITKYYGFDYSLTYLREQSHIDRSGVSLLGLSEAAEKIGFRTLAVKLPFGDDNEDSSLRNAPLPCIVHWNENHFVVIYKISRKYVFVADPADGKQKLTHEDFKKFWLADKQMGFALLLERTPALGRDEGEGEANIGVQYLWSYVLTYRRYLYQMAFLLLVTLVFQFISPFLTQAVVDFGIKNEDLRFVVIILLAQVVMFFGETLVSIFQAWISLHLSTRINVSMISDFLLKMMKLPIGFFDSKNMGDLLQRISDHDRIESFVTNRTLNVVFSLLSIVVFSFVLLSFDSRLFFLYLISTFLYFAWIVVFLKQRKKYDYLAFQEMSRNQDSLIEIINGMPEIKLQNSEVKRRWKWVEIQAKLFRIKMKSLVIEQFQSVGGQFITRLKDILISFMAAKAVIDGQITLGMMMAVQFIIGQLNSPLEQLIEFVRQAQDAKISLDRLGEIHNAKDEKTQDWQTNEIPMESIWFKNVSFKYSPINPDVLKNIDIEIPRNKVTAIVGLSGSGKTTMLKLLLGFYQPTEGRISVGNTELSHINSKSWRAHIGAVLQDGYIFSDTIESNIAESDVEIDRVKVRNAIEAANIQDYVDELPIGAKTKLHAGAHGLSQGQKQRMLIARAIYKNPKLLIFDEATNALDANNEKIIMENLNRFFEGKTVVVVAHRLSTVKDADNIIVLKGGVIIEQGSHTELVNNRADYYELIRNQLELGQ